MINKTLTGLQAAPHLARAIAEFCHEGQFYGNDPYITHPARVAATVRNYLPGSVPGGSTQLAAISAAWLHDTVEDAPEDNPLILFLDECEARDIPLEFYNRVATAVRLVTKTPGLNLEDYYHTIATDEIARAVKLADIIDNFRGNHKLPDDGRRTQMAYKYSLGLDILAP